MSAIRTRNWASSGWTGRNQNWWRTRRLTTHHAQTVDEYGILFVNLFEMNGVAPSQVKHIIIASVVPPVEATLRQLCEKCFHLTPLWVEPGMKTGMALLIDNPAELGADRLADSSPPLSAAAVPASW